MSGRAEDLACLKSVSSMALLPWPLLAIACMEGGMRCEGRRGEGMRALKLLGEAVGDRGCDVCSEVSDLLDRRLARRDLWRSGSQGLRKKAWR